MIAWTDERDSSDPRRQNPDETPDGEQLPDLRDTLIAGKDGEAQPSEIIRAFLTSTVYFLSSEEVTPETASVNPLTLQDNEGNPLIALFSGTDVVPAEYAEHAPHAVDAPGVAVVQSLSGAGIIIDAGQEHGFQISSEGVDRIREDFLSPTEGE
ncbi:SseB family protein [Nesterenkonia sp. PF2B19]|uniref:SseB family protein n=1 Tax=Nesterenkonia sp. PF2B19 TaxID=1881858 RepID=UPI0008733183|nr:SseB family protein [Nesterenkonia sp. PF2B19]